MTKQPLLISDQNKTTELQIEQMAIYLQSKIIEAFDKDNQVYYLFFYKEKYLTYVKPTKLKRRSHIAQAFTKGLVVPDSHPLILSLLSSMQTYKKRTFKQLIKKAETENTPHEAALIATFFESFISKKTIFAYIQSIFYEFRRNGQMFSSYKIIRILLDFCPRHSWVRGLSSDINFIKYGKLYDQLSDTLFEKDPIYMEKALFFQKHNEHRFQQLDSLLRKQSRWMDLIALYIQNINQDTYPSLIHLLEGQFTKNEVIIVLEHLSSDLLDVHQDLLMHYLLHKEPEKVITLIIRHNLTLSPSQTHTFEKILEEVDIDPEQFPTDKIISFIVPLFQIKPEKAEKLLLKSIILQLQEHDIETIINWLTPLKGTLLALPILKKLDAIQKLTNDPDQQFLLGQLYYQFKQYEQAIECFSWEMELKSVDPKPVQWLSKIYNEIGMEDEHKAYRQLYIDMEKRA